MYIYANCIECLEIEIHAQANKSRMHLSFPTLVNGKMCIVDTLVTIRTEIVFIELVLSTLTS